MLILLGSCSYEVDNKDAFRLADAIHESFRQNDTTILKQVFEFEMDSISEKDKSALKAIKDFYTPETKILKVDTTNFYNIIRSIEMFYKKGSNFYRISSDYYSDSTNSHYVESIRFYNINEKCEEYNNEPYKPTGDIDFKRISWTTDYYGKTFKSGTIELQNNTDSDLTYSKFRVILKKGSNYWNAETFFNQTVESYKPIYKGDIATIEVPGMTDYFTGFEIKKDNLQFTAELIEVKPKPESYWCKKLEELKSEIIANTE